MASHHSMSTTVKRRIAQATPASTVDVALLDSLDGGADAPFVAVSGPDAARGAASLRPLGFDVDVVGSEVGQAATLKYLRSIFMKSLEALALEFASLASGFEGGGTVRKSIERNLGPRYDEFIDLLIVTNRVHAARRVAELTDFDLDVVEMHHRTKKDAPSGTAKRLLEILQEVRGGDRAIAAQSVRAGDIVGEHTVIFAGAGERP